MRFYGVGVYIFIRVAENMPPKWISRAKNALRERWNTIHARAKYTASLRRKHTTPLERRKALEHYILTKMGISKNSIDGILVNKLVRAEDEYYELNALRRKNPEDKELERISKEAERERLDANVTLRKRIGWEKFGKLIRMIHGLEK